ncbi:exopolysaccharide transport family protein [Tardiphaga sp. 37S4]|uniref:GumC family protein n=1 Tax=Tardiphaga sp. 37S4 TaxID=1404741 RepID=UPI001E5F18FF|nr:exopolysaccharide transport family protein [Tardiphaga sp. 37S4]UFS78300.1 exopolysaccharide transport family protein [Tardiphaga sp. 37S4]
MRLAFWRAGKGDASVERAIKAPTMPNPVSRKNPEKKAERVIAAPAPDLGDLDLRALWQALVRRKTWILVPTLLALVGSLVIVNMITPRFKSEARILIDGRENVFLRPSGERNEERTSLDAEAVTSQVQLLLSRDLAREIIKKNKLAERPEFDPVLQGAQPWRSLLGLMGIGRDPFSMTPEERVLDAYYERLTAYAVDKSRVMVVEFQSRDPELAARVANSIADGYLVMQQNARQNQARSAGQWLSGEIDDLRKKVVEAEARAEEFRSKSSLFIGTNNTSLSNQQLGEINSQLNNARSLKSDAESKARLIKDMLQTGKPIEFSEVLNSDLIRRLSEQRVTLRAQLAEQSSTLLDAHPRIKELRAQLGDLDKQLRDEAAKLSRIFENDARIASGRVDGLTNNLEQLKRQATSSNGQDVQLRALEREARAQRDLLESYLAKYREASTRENIEAAPTDGRIISRAIVSNTPAYPKKLPIVLIATLATLMLTAGGIVTSELLRMTAPRGAAPMVPVAQARVTEPAFKPFVDKVPAAVREPETVVAPGIVPEPAPVAVPQPVVRDTHPELAAGVSEIEQLAQEFRAAGKSARKITILGTGHNDNIALTALTLSRILSRDAKVVLVDLASSSPTLEAVSNDPRAPGLAELMLGEASFGQVITKDRMSGLHMVAAGRAGADRSLLQSPRLTMALDALLRVYDHVLLDAGTAADLPAGLLTDQARAVVVPEVTMSMDARELMAEQLKAVGFADVKMLRSPPPANDPVGPGGRVFAA